MIDLGYFAHLFAEQEERKEVQADDEVVAPVRVGSIKDALKRVAQPEVPRSKSAPKKELKPAQSEQVHQALVMLVEQLKKKGKRALAAYLSDPMMEVRDGEVRFTVASKTLEKEIAECWNSLAKMLNSQGHSASLDIVIDAQKVQEYKLFTPQEQFEALCKDYPKLQEFKERFGLDLEL